MIVDDMSASNGTRKDLLTFDTKFDLSYSQFGPVSLSKVFVVESWLLLAVMFAGGLTWTH